MSLNPNLATELRDQEQKALDRFDSLHGHENNHTEYYDQDDPLYVMQLHDRINRGMHQSVHHQGKLTRLATIPEAQTTTSSQQALSSQYNTGIQPKSNLPSSYDYSSANHLDFYTQKGLEQARRALRQASTSRERIEGFRSSGGDLDCYYAQMNKLSKIQVVKAYVPPTAGIRTYAGRFEVTSKQRIDNPYCGPQRILKRLSGQPLPNENRHELQKMEKRATSRDLVKENSKDAVAEECHEAESSEGRAECAEQSEYDEEIEEEEDEGEEENGHTEEKEDVE